MYKVIFNKDEQNYEEFDSLEKAEKFAKEYANTEIKIEKALEKIIEDTKMQIKINNKNRYKI